MFDIGFSEIVLIGIVALLVVDPKELPTIMFKAGRFFRQFKIIASRVTDTIGDVMHELEAESYRQQYKNDKHLIESDRDADRAIEMLPLPQNTQSEENTSSDIVIAPTDLKPDHAKQADIV